MGSRVRIRLVHLLTSSFHEESFIFLEKILSLTLMSGVTAYVFSTRFIEVANNLNKVEKGEGVVLIL